MDGAYYVVTIRSPKGVRHVEIPADQVRLFAAEHGDDWRAALFLADQDLQFHARVAEIQAARDKGLE